MIQLRQFSRCVWFRFQTNYQLRNCGLRYFCSNFFFEVVCYWMSSLRGTCLSTIHQRRIRSHMSQKPTTAVAVRCVWVVYNDGVIWFNLKIMLSFYLISLQVESRQHKALLSATCIKCTRDKE